MGVLVDTLVVPASTHAHLSAGCGNPNSHQCLYPEGQVQHEGVEDGVAGAGAAGADPGKHWHLSPFVGADLPNTHQCE